MIAPYESTVFPIKLPEHYDQSTSGIYVPMFVARALGGLRSRDLFLTGEAFYLLNYQSLRAPNRI